LSLLRGDVVACDGLVVALIGDPGFGLLGNDNPGDDGEVSATRPPLPKS
jgi:hypothetical protein